jgi:hypothetical protein
MEQFGREAIRRAASSAVAHGTAFRGLTVQPIVVGCRLRTPTPTPAFGSRELYPPIRVPGRKDCSILGALDDIFALQDRITTSVVGAILPTLEQAEIKRARRKRTGSLIAYDFYLRGMASVHEWTREGISEALGLFYEAIKLDPEFGSAYGMAAWCYLRHKSDGWMADRVQESAEAARHGPLHHY